MTRIRQTLRRVGRGRPFDRGDTGSAAEVGGFEPGVVAEVAAGAGAGDLAGFQDVGVRGDFQGQVGVLLHQEDRDALLAVDLHNLLENGRHQAGGDAERRFVEHEELRLAHERPADGEHLLFSARERAGGLLEAFLEAGEEGENVVAGAFDEGAVALEVGAEGEVFGDGEVGEDEAVFGNVAESAGDDVVGGEAGDVFTGEADGAGGRADESGNGLEGGGFARAVAADEGDDGSGGDLQGDVGHGADGTVGDGEVGDGQHERRTENGERRFLTTDCTDGHG